MLIINCNPHYTDAEIAAFKRLLASYLGSAEQPEAVQVYPAEFSRLGLSGTLEQIEALAIQPGTRVALVPPRDSTLAILVAAALAGRSGQLPLLPEDMQEFIPTITVHGLTDPAAVLNVIARQGNHSCTE